MDFNYRNPAIGIIIIVIVIALTVSIVLMGNFGNGQKVDITCSASYSVLEQKFRFKLYEGTVSEDKTVLATKPLWNWFWNTGTLVLRATIVDFHPASWDANIQGGSGDADLGQISSIIGGSTPTGVIHLRHLVPGNYTVNFELVELTGILNQNSEVKAGETLFFSFNEGDSYIYREWDSGEEFE